MMFEVVGLKMKYPHVVLILGNLKGLETRRRPYNPIP